MFIIDTYAWIEYFDGSRKGEKLQKLLQDEKNIFFTVECCLAEMKGWSLKKNKNFNDMFKIVRANSRIISITEYDWIHAAEIRFEQRKLQENFGLIDAMLIVKQKELNCKIISGDYHFKHIKDVMFIG